MIVTEIVFTPCLVLEQGKANIIPFMVNSNLFTYNNPLTLNYNPIYGK